MIIKLNESNIPKGVYNMPTESKITPPRKGWVQLTYYLVRVAFNKYNPVHRAVFFTGFLHEGIPAGYAQVWKGGGYERPYNYDEIYYMEVIKVIATEKELETDYFEEVTNDGDTKVDDSSPN